MDVTIIVPTALALVAVVCAMLLTHRCNSNDRNIRKFIKFFGILVSTIPIVGLIQGAIASRLDADGYASACFGQAAVGVIVYLVGTYALKFLSAT